MGALKGPQPSESEKLRGSRARRAIGGARRSRPKQISKDQGRVAAQAQAGRHHVKHGGWAGVTGDRGRAQEEKDDN